MNVQVAFTGTNYPPLSESIADALSDLQDRLRAETAHLETRRDELLSAMGRMPEITDDTISGKVADFTKQLTQFIGQADDWKDQTKKPVLAADRAIMTQHKTLTTAIVAAKDSVLSLQTKYLKIKAEQERKIREEAERVAREAAEKARLEAEAAAAALASDADLDKAMAAEEAAIAAQQQAEEAAARAQAKPAELSRVTGNYGSTQSLRKSWVFVPESINMQTIDLEALRPYLAPDDLHKAIRKAIAAQRYEIKGVVIKEELKAR